MNPNPYTIEMAHAALEEARQALPNHPSFAWDHIAALDTIHHFLGPSNTRDVLEGRSLGTPSVTSSREQQLHFMRALMAADALFRLQHQPGFEQWIESFSHEHQQKDALFNEAFLARVMLSIGYKLTFVPRRKKVKRPDVVIDEGLLGEFKLVRSTTNFNPKAILDRLNDSVEQFEALDESHIYGWIPMIHIPFEWLEAGKGEEVVETVEGFFKVASTNIAGVKLCHLAHAPWGDSGGVAVFGVKALPNSRSALSSKLREMTSIYPRVFWK